MADTKFTIKALRINAQMTQQEVAEYLDVALKTYQSYEAEPDKMSWGQAKKLARLFKVTLDMLD